MNAICRAAIAPTRPLECSNRPGSSQGSAHLTLSSKIRNQLPDSSFLLKRVPSYSNLNLHQGVAGLCSPRFSRTRRRLSAAGIGQASAVKQSGPVGSNQMLVYVPPHPLISHWIAVLRNEATPSPVFHSALAELGRLLIYEASRDWLVTVEAQVQTPCGVADVKFVDPREPIQVVPILRAGLVLVEHMSTILPATQTYHLGYARDEYTLQPSQYLNKLPQSFSPTARILVADPMLATGGTIVAAIEELKRRGADHKLMRVVSALAAPPALKKLSEKFPGLRVYTGIIDPEVSDKGFIVPGVGDAGDRSYGT